MKTNLAKRTIKFAWQGRMRERWFMYRCKELPFLKKWYRKIKE